MFSKSEVWEVWGSIERRGTKFSIKIFKYQKRMATLKSVLVYFDVAHYETETNLNQLFCGMSLLILVHRLCDRFNKKNLLIR